MTGTCNANEIRAKGYPPCATAAHGNPVEALFPAGLNPLTEQGHIQAEQETLDFLHQLPLLPHIRNRAGITYNADTRAHTPHPGGHARFARTCLRLALQGKVRLHVLGRRTYTVTTTALPTEKPHQSTLPAPGNPRPKHGAADQRKEKHRRANPRRTQRTRRAAA